MHNHILLVGCAASWNLHELLLGDLLYELPLDLLLGGRRCGSLCCVRSLFDFFGGRLLDGKPARMLKMMLMRLLLLLRRKLLQFCHFTTCYSTVFACHGDVVIVILNILVRLLRRCVNNLAGPRVLQGFLLRLLSLVLIVMLQSITHHLATNSVGAFNISRAVILRCSFITFLKPLAWHTVPNDADTAAGV